jgi:histidyl-tRNA synthetase
MGSRTNTKAPSGMRDFLPDELARRYFVIAVAREVYESYGFLPLETPAMENLEVLLGKYGEDEKLIYRILHRGEALDRILSEGVDAVQEADLADLALRYDLTVPLARIVAEYPDLPRFFKRYQIQPVWRADRPGKGRFREFVQCDVDIIGTRSLLAEAEVSAAACAVLDRLGFDDYTLWINHRQLLRGLVRAAGIDPALESTTLVAVDKLDKIGIDGVACELEKRGIAATQARTLLDLIARSPSSDQAVLAELAVELGSDEAAAAAIRELDELLGLLATTPAGKRARLSIRLARGLSYYTGPIFEITTGDLASSVAGGGRYDDLIGMFGRQQVPAVGLSLGLERILVVMAERAMFADLTLGPQVVLCWRDVEAEAALRVAHALRDQGLRVEVYPEPVKLGKQIQYAASIGARIAAILGPQETADGTVSLKYLESGEQVTVTVAEVGRAVNGCQRAG